MGTYKYYFNNRLVFINLIWEKHAVKHLILIILVLLISGIGRTECDLFFPSTWLEDSDGPNKLHLRIANDRNLYFSYQIEDISNKINLSHKVYVCSGKHLYLVSEDDTVDLFAIIERTEEDKLILHFVNKAERIIAKLLLKKTQ